MAGKAGWDEAAWFHAGRGPVAMVKAELLEPPCPTCKAHSTATAADSRDGLTRRERLSSAARLGPWGRL